MSETCILNKFRFDFILCFFELGGGGGLGGWIESDSHHGT